MMSSLPRLVLLLCVLLLLSSLSAAQPNFSWRNVTILSISSSNCTGSGSQALNCVFPVTAIVTTSGFGTLNINQADLVVTGPNGVEFGPGGGPGSGGATNLLMNPADSTNTTVIATIFPSAYNPAIMASSTGAAGPLFNISIRSWGGGNTTPMLPAAISFAYDAPPTLQSISGCTGSGTSTTGCNPSSTVLTFTGSGFRWFSNQGGVQLWIGTSSTGVTGGGGGGPGGPGPNGGGAPALQVVSDSLLYVNFSASYVYLLLPQHYNGVSLPVFFNEQSFSVSQGGFYNSYTNQLSISFIPLPVPVVTAVTVGGNSACQGVNGTGPYINCIPLVSYINLVGQYMYDVNATVGGVPCASIVPMTASMTRCLLPLVGGVGPYSVVVTDWTGSSVALGNNALISFTSAPTVSSLTTCTNTGLTNNAGLPVSGYCAAGTTVTVSGNNFVVGDATAAVVLQFNPSGPPNQRPAYAQSQINMTCGSVSVLSTSTLTCVLPTPTGNASLVVYGVNLGVMALFNSGSSVSNMLNVVVYQSPTAPVISSVTGCQPQSALALANCNSGASITLTGQNLANVQFVDLVQNGPPSAVQCAIVSATATSLVCTVPTFDPVISPVTVGTTYLMSASIFSGGGPGNGPPTQIISNAFSISFTLVTPQTNWNNVQIVGISSGNCSQSGAQALNCIFPVTALITTTGFGSLSLRGAALVVTGPNGLEIGNQNGQTNLQRNWADPTNTTLFATIFPAQYNTALMAPASGGVAPLFNLSIRSWGGQNTGQFPGISFAYDPPPQLQTIAGCTGSGTSTTSCDPSVTILTFTGSGFRWFSNYGQVQMWINSASTQVRGGQGGGGNQQGPALQVVSDSLMYANLTNAWVYILLPVHYNGVVLPILFNEQSWSWSAGGYVNSYTNSLSISFIPLPAPNVISVTASGSCTGVNGTGPFTNCIPLVSYITLQGKYMYEVNATVGGVNCAATVPLSASSTRCLLPYVGGVGPYPVVASDWTGSSTVLGNSALVGFTSSPTINGVTTCMYTGQVNQAGAWFGGWCQQGQTITVSGNNFPLSDPTVQVIAQWNPQGNPNQRPAYGRSQINITCGSPSILSAQSITCVLPTLTGNASLVVYGQNVNVRVYFSSGAQPTNQLSLPLYQYPTAPSISSPSSGCTQVSATTIANCVSGSIVTITGTNLQSAIGFGPFVTPVLNQGGGLPAWTCSVQSSTATSIVCTMPTFDPVVSPVTPGTSYPMVVNAGVSQGNFAMSNAFTVSFSLGTTVTPSTGGGGSSGLSRSAIIAIAVIVPIVGVLIILVAFLVLTKRAGGLKLPQLSSGKENKFNKQVDSESGGVEID